MFDPVTGQPLWPVEERPVPKSDVPGEESWPTQPFPTKPPPYARLDFNIEDINPYVGDAERERLRDILRNARNEGIFTPQTLTREKISVPGEFGGSNWGGTAADPTTGWIYVRTVDTPAIHKLRVPGVGTGNTPAARGRAVYMAYCEGCHGDVSAQGIRSYDGAGVINIAALGEERVVSTIRSGIGPMPAHTDQMINGEQMEWLVTYLNNPAAAGRGGGAGPAPAQQNPRMPFIEGLTRYTGPYVRAFDKDNGKILWEHDLNANPEGLPSVFEVSGRQYVAFTASYYASLDPSNISTFQGKVENQGYYVFSLPK